MYTVTPDRRSIRPILQRKFLASAVRAVARREASKSMALRNSKMQCKEGGVRKTGKLDKAVEILLTNKVSRPQQTIANIYRPDVRMLTMDVG